MTKSALTRPETHKIKRSEFRQKQSATLRLAKGNCVVLILARDRDDEKLVLDRKYFDELVQGLRSAIETLEITTDQKLFAQILKSVGTLDEDIRLGKLHSFEEAFRED